MTNIMTGCRCKTHKDKPLSGGHVGPAWVVRNFLHFHTLEVYQSLHILRCQVFAQLRVPTQLACWLGEIMHLLSSFGCRKNNDKYIDKHTAELQRKPSPANQSNIFYTR